MIRSRRKSENIRRNISSVSSGETYKTGVARGLVAGVRYIAIPTIAGALFSYRRASRAPAAPQASAPSSVDQDAAAGQAISACGGDARKTLKGLIAANDFLRS